MPQPALSVRPASWTLFSMSSIESRMVPDTVQLMVEVAGLCSSAPALDVTRPAGIAPWRNDQRNDSYHCSRTSGDRSASRPLLSGDISYPRCHTTLLDKECCQHLLAGS